MKKFLLITIILLCLTNLSFAQQKIEKYCEVMSRTKLLSKYLDVNISFGKIESHVLDSSKTNEILSGLKSHKFETNVDLLNYMTSMGWKLVTASATESSVSSEGVLEFFFEKEFDKFN